MKVDCYVCGEEIPTNPHTIDPTNSVRALIDLGGKKESVYAHYECAQKAFFSLRRDLALSMTLVPEDLGLSSKFIAMQKALDAVLLFHGGGPWDKEKRSAWFRATGSYDATTKVLCDVVRSSLGEGKA